MNETNKKHWPPEARRGMLAGENPSVEEWRAAMKREEDSEIRWMKKHAPNYRPKPALPED